MCLIKIRRDDVEDEFVPYRRVVRSSERIRTSSPRRASKVIAVAPPPEPARSPRGYVLPPPQPVPVFVDPPPLAPVTADVQTDARYVRVSPRSSLSDRREDDYVYTREVRREYSPARSSRGGDFYEHRHIETPRRSSRSRSRSRRRIEDDYDDDYYDDRREKVRVSSRRVYRD